MDEENFMKLLNFLLILVSTEAFAHSPPTDACLSSIQIGPDHYWYCETGIFKTQLSSPVKTEIKGEDWVTIKKSLFLSEVIKKRGPKGIKIPNESCALGFSIGANQFLRCDSGLYSGIGKNFDEIDSEEWNQKAKSLVEVKQDLDSFSGCTKTGLMIECPDGIYKKDINLSSLELEKALEDQRQQLIMRRGPASK